MPIYPPRNTATKKAQIFDYKIFEFLKDIELNKSKDKIIKKSEAVRDAKINLIKARLSLSKLYKANDKTDATLQLYEKLNTDMENWKSFSFEEIKEFCIKQKRA